MCPLPLLRGGRSQSPMQQWGVAKDQYEQYVQSAAEVIPKPSLCHKFFLAPMLVDHVAFIRLHERMTFMNETEANLARRLT